MQSKKAASNLGLTATIAVVLFFSCQLKITRACGRYGLLLLHLHPLLDYGMKL